ncbi:MAG: HD domain-containing protein [Oscillospiraceae bacterium]|nr:HD domain-containing protein [Oscillospiraceae bacterium]
MSEKLSAPSEHSNLKHNYITTMLCLAGIALNLILCEIAGRLQLPLYLDTVGSVAVAIMGGYLPGVIVGFATNMLKSITDPSAMYYGVLNVLIALTASLFAKKQYFRKLPGILLTMVVFTLIGGGLGTLIPWYLDDVAFDSESLSAAIYGTGHFNQISAHLLANLAADFLDKAVSVLLVLLIVHLLPEKIHSMFRFNGWMQTPLSPEETSAAKRSNSRVMSLRTKILLVLSISLILVSVGATAISIHLYGVALIRDHTKLAEGTASIAASALDPDKVGQYLQEGESAEGYAEMEKLLYDIRESSTDILYLYVYQIREDGCHVVFDLDTEEQAGAAPGEVIPFDESFSAYIPKLLRGEQIDPIITDDTYGWLLTSYQPVYDSSGNCVCYAAADISMDQIGITERKFFIQMLSLFLGFFILIFCVVRWLIEYHIILPVNSIARSTGTFAYDSESARENSIERIRELNIHTGDEVENLYHAIAKTSDDSMRYVADVQEKTAQLSKMQRALIMVLADIVESRDKNTGAHVRKTAAYTEIILNEMRKKGFYADQLTDEFISDVVNSAPLHDVGKIQVPDAILNKPGRLNDDEFGIMKTHTTAGRDIISQAIELVPVSGYLNEARNLAAYHHEKWDGSGYPNGIAGEEIPLSARVMAVADVFDALVSNRSYKKPFTFEEAMKIITEGSGRHFDPLIVEAFVSAEDEVRRVENEFSQMTNESGCFK